MNPKKIEPEVSYVVSDDPTMIEIPNDQTSVSNYTTDQAAINAIENGYHGEYGDLYVLKITTELVATAKRGWTMVRDA